MTQAQHISGLRDHKVAPNRQAGPAPRAKAFARAKNHSRRVNVLKLALPLSAVAMAFAFVGYTFLMAPSDVAVAVEGAAYSDGKLVMANPKLDGFTRENRPYSMTAARAIQQADKSGIIDLEKIAAKLPVDAINWATIDAATGTYDRDKNTLVINSPVTVKTTDGMVAKLKSAHLDIAKGGMTTTEPVDISLDGAKIAADSMTVLENGKVLIFEKRVRMDIDPEKLRAKQEATGGTNAAN